MLKAFAALFLSLMLGSSHAAPDSPSLQTDLLAAEESLYRAVFDDCNADNLSKLLTDDLEFFHDKWGQIAKSKLDFVGAIRGSCENQRVGKEVRTRRVLVAGSFKVYRMGNFGALAIGSHRFFHLPEGKPPVPTETAQFANLWRFSDGHWLLARVLSYDHVSSASSAGAK